MSNSCTYKFKDHRFVDLAEAEFASALPQLKNAAALYRLLKDYMPDGAGKVHIEGTHDSIKFRFNDGPWQEPDQELRSESDNSALRDALPDAEIYKYDFKAHIKSKANSGNSFIYDAKINNPGGQSQHDTDYIPAIANLRELAAALQERFRVSVDDLLKLASQFDLGTFQVDLLKDGDSYRISRFFQTQAPSLKQERKSNSERELAKLKSDKAELIDSNLKLTERVAQLESTMRDYEALQNTDRLYRELLHKLGIKDDNDSKIVDLNLATLREKVRSLIKTKAIGIISRELTYMGFEVDDLTIVKERIEAVITTYVATRASHKEIEALNGIIDLTRLQDIAPALYSEFTSVVADRILHFFSSSESRKCASSAKVQTIMNDYDLEFFSVEPGSEATTKECRFVSVRESGFARGACVETVSLGIRQLSTKSVIYKADVIISV